MSLLSNTAVLLGKELRTEFRSRELLTTTIVFILIVIVLFSFTFDPTSDESRRFAPGLLWLAFLFASSLMLQPCFLREQRNDIVIGVADPKGAAMYNLFAHGEAKASAGGSITEGIGLGRVTRIIEDSKVDRSYLIPDEEAVPLIFDLVEHEGLCMGGSTGINVAGAIRLAREMGPGHTIVTILADHGARYQSKLFDPQFLRNKRLPVPEWLERRSHIEVPFEKA